MKKSISVDVAGQRFTLKTDADEAYVKSLARYVTEKMEEARKGAKLVATQSIALLAALNIADECFQARQREKAFRKRVREKSKTILDYLDREKA